MLLIQNIKLLALVQPIDIIFYVTIKCCIILLGVRKTFTLSAVYVAKELHKGWGLPNQPPTWAHLHLTHVQDIKKYQFEEEEVKVAMTIPWSGPLTCQVQPCFTGQSLQCCHLQPDKPTSRLLIHGLPDSARLHCPNYAG